MDDYLARQRERWASAGQRPETAVVPGPGEPIAASGPTSDMPVQSEEEAPVVEEVVPNNNLEKVHILPVSSDDVPEETRLRGASEYLRLCMAARARIVPGVCFENSTGKFAVVSTIPEEGGFVTTETDFFVDGSRVSYLDKVQLAALSTSGDEDTVFESLLNPHLEARLNSSFGIAVSPNQVLVTLQGTKFIVSAIEPVSAVSALGVITRDTTVYVDVDSSEEFSRVHVLPFQDTLPRVYEYDIFEEYLKPYFTANPLARYSANTQFVYHGVQFKVVCVDPSDGVPRRVGAQTQIHCDGLLHSSLRTMLPPELLEQLSTLPPGLQMLLLNTELMASADMLDRFIDLQETLAARRGVSDGVLDRIPTESYAPSTREGPESNTQCMICLSDFEPGERLRRLPCAHVYHQPCIDEWLHRCTDCPLCKTNVEQAMSH
jgi:hypothetical protein